MAAEVAALVLNADGLFASLLFIMVAQCSLEDQEAVSHPNH